MMDASSYRYPPLVPIAGSDGSLTHPCTPLTDLPAIATLPDPDPIKYEESDEEEIDELQDDDDENGMEVEHEIGELALLNAAPEQMRRATQVPRQITDERNEQTTGSSSARALATARRSTRAWHVVRRPDTTQTQTQTQTRVGRPPLHRIWDLTSSAQAIRGAPQGDVRSRKYWVRDGTIVLRAGRMLFKIGRQLFSTKCTRLRQAIQDFPMPGAVPAGTEVVDGCPVFGLNLRTIGIGGLDFEWFLIGLYCPDRYVPAYTGKLFWLRMLTRSETDLES